MVDGSDSFFIQIGKNRVFMAAFFSWLTAQTLKVTLGVLRERRFNFKWFVGSGGMPSSHAALAMGLAVATGLSEGFHTGLFTLAFVFAMITMFDAQGVRRQSGRQAEVLNQIVEDLYTQKGLHPDRLKALFGHTPIEVLAGGAVGIVVAMACFRWL
ncbi:MAG: divergent PAP2 family protein [Candidatus Omnitrophica bacterium]|nr:divergent PAP2 family protein [Candidatus Omnitrophota bacterium]